MDSPGYVRPAGNGPKGETGTAVKYLKTESLKKLEGFDTTSIGRGSAPHGGGGSFGSDDLYNFRVRNAVYFCGHLHLAFGYTDQRTVPFC